jgi:hypothetical protein
MHDLSRLLDVSHISSCSDNLLEAHVCVQDEHGNEASINQGNCRASGEGNDSQRNKCDGYGPVIESVIPLLHIFNSRDSQCRTSRSSSGSCHGQGEAQEWVQRRSCHP